MIEGRDIGAVVAPGRGGEGLPARRRGRARATPYLRSPRAFRPRRWRPICATATSETPSTRSPPRTRCCSTPRVCRWMRSSSESPSSSSRGDEPDDAIWAVGRATIGTAVKVVAPLRVYGAERVPREGGLVVASNHLSWIDPARARRGDPADALLHGEGRGSPRAGLGQLMRSFGAFSVRRGESDREAVRTMRQIVRDGHALGLFVEGRGSGPACPGSCSRAPRWWRSTRACRGSARRSTARSSGAWAASSPCRSRGAIRFLRRTAARRQGLQGGVGGDRARDQAVGLARGDARARPAARRDTAHMSEIADDVEIAGTVAIVGFPNVGKSTLINRLTSTRTAVVHETPGVTRDRKELLCEWSGTTVPPHRHGRCRPGRHRAIRRPDRGPGAQAVEEADLVLLVVDATAGVTPGDEELAEILRSSRRQVLVLRTSSTTRAATSRRSSSIASGSATRSRSRPSTATARATFSTRSSAGSPVTVSARSARRRSGRDPGAAECREVVAAERPRRR